ncbi:MAG TPA: DUF1566 domain-containing protein [Candidatus Gracilibacteria bacterium]|nr:DUF1566 domain-containing protein [Candidatus Gracilibacteria bacterium]
MYRIITIGFLLILSIGLSSCSSDNLGANLNPFQAESSDRLEIILANGQTQDLSPYLNRLLRGESVQIGEQEIRFSTEVKDLRTGNIYFPKWPALEAKNLKIPSHKMVYEDQTTRLVWEQDASQSGLKSYSEAEKYCKEFGLNYYNQEFRIPSPQELKSILKDESPYIDTSIFTNLAETYWTTHEYGFSFYNSFIK